MNQKGFNPYDIDCPDCPATRQRPCYLDNGHEMIHQARIDLYLDERAAENAMLAALHPDD